MGHLIYYGHAAFEVSLDGKKILIDPWLTNPKSPVKPSEVKGVDLVIITHDHPDHVGDAVDILKNNPNAKVAAIFELASHIAEQIGDQGRAIGGNIGGPMIIDGLKVALTPATHSSARGNPTGVVIIGNEATIYHAGDTGVTMDMKLIGDLYRPHIALLPIGGHFTMDPLEAAKAVELIRPKVTIPMHYGTFPVLYGDPNQFKKLVEEKCLPTKVEILNPGDKYEFPF
ncbi:MAG: metal-dependent hydrolase [Desulfurococcales archaeon]|nr:metal-dependent hydrolase [Desulfurococcales archaeon]